MDHGFTRPQELWEMSDGSIFLLRELSQVRSKTGVDAAHSLVLKHMTHLADLGFVDHFKHASSMKENLFKTLTTMVSQEGLGKKKFRSFVEIFLDPSFRNAKNDHQNCACSA